MRRARGASKVAQPRDPPGPNALQASATKFFARLETDLQAPTRQLAKAGKWTAGECLARYALRTAGRFDGQETMHQLAVLPSNCMTQLGIPPSRCFCGRVYPELSGLITKSSYA